MRRNSRMICLLGAAIFVLSLLVPGVLGLAPIALAADPVEITILHTNDVHARVDVEPFASALKKQRADDGKNVLLLSAGDALHGQSIATLQKGESIVEIMNKAGYDALSPGNHDFNYTYQHLLELEKKMNFKILGANVKKDNVSIFKQDYIIKEFEGVKVGIFGLATPETKTKTNPANVTGITFDEPVAIAEQMVEELRGNQGCDVVIALVHLGLDEATLPEWRSTAVAAVEGIDLVVDGHSHDDLTSGETDHDGAPIVQAYQNGERIGEVTISVADDKTVTIASIMLHERDSEAKEFAYKWTADAAVADIIAAMKTANEPTLSKVVAHTDYDLFGGTPHTRNAETNLANLITDSMLIVSGADVALTNGGGIRDVIPAGDITVDHVLMVLPFGSFIVNREVTGANIKAALEFGIDAYPERAGKYPQIAGMKAIFDPSKPAGSRILKITMADGTPMQDDKVYTLATNDFMAVGGDGYTMLDTGGFISFSALDEAFIDYLETKPTIKAEPEGRLSALVAAEGISLDKTELALEPAASQTLKVTLTPDTTNEGVVWASDNTAVATVDQTGKVTAVAAGVANITAKTEFGGKAATCKVTVAAASTPKTGWDKDGKYWRYYGDDNKPLTGWLKDKDKWYYLKSDGIMHVGWIKLDGKWYYLQRSGSMKTGWLQEYKKWYYLESSGAMKSGWLKDKGKWYFLQPTGVMKTGWMQDGGKWYYLKASGAMHTGWCLDGSTWYYLQASGAMWTGWLQEGSTWYYLKPNGAMAANETYTIGSKRHSFDANGKWLRTR